MDTTTAINLAYRIHNSRHNLVNEYLVPGRRYATAILFAARDAMDAAEALVTAAEDLRSLEMAKLARICVKALDRGTLRGENWRMLAMDRPAAHTSLRARCVTADARARRVLAQAAA